jgi:cytochrome c553
MTKSTRPTALLVAGALLGIGGLWAAGSAAFAAQQPAATSTTANAGRLLAGNCFQCHGTNGRGGPFESIAGESATELYNELKRMQTSTTTGEKAIMNAHAAGYTDAELKLIAAYFAAQR